MTSGPRHIQDITPYLKYFPTSRRETFSIKNGSKLEDTIKFMPWMVKHTLYQTKYFAELFKARTVRETCQKLWNWVYNHIQYHKDKPGKEQVKSPQCVVHDAVIGSDCEDYTGLISSVLANLKIDSIFRIAQYYVEDGFQHIYPIVPLKDGSYITMDCVVSQYNYEVPFINHIDQPLNMDLEFLNGLPEDDMSGLGTTSEAPINIDAQDLIDEDSEIEGLGRGKGKLKNFVKKVQDSKVATTVRKGLHVANRLNPAAGLLRVGILAAMKMNMFKIPEMLRWSYLTPEQAQAKDLDMAKYHRLVDVRGQLEKIFFRAGGKTENLKKEILKGRGNRSKEVPVSGLGYVDQADYTEQHNLSQILGMDTYQSEMDGVEGLGSLGEPATGAAIAAATAALAAISGLLKSIGSLRKKDSTKSGAATDSPDSVPDPSGEGTSTPGDGSTTDPQDTTSPVQSSENRTASSTSDQGSASGGAAQAASNNAASDNPVSDGGANTDTPAISTPGSDGGNDTGNQENASANTTAPAARESGAGNSNQKTAEPGTFAKLGNWIKANPLPSVGIGLAVAGLCYAGYRMLSKKEDSKHEKPETVSGFSKRRKRTPFKLQIKKLK